MSIRGLLTMVLVGLAGTLPAVASAAPPAAVAVFDRFISKAVPLCESSTAVLCIASGWRYADSNRDDRLSAIEVASVRGALDQWSQWRSGDMSLEERNALVLGLWMLDLIGVDAVMRSYDFDGDGQLSRAELLTDVRLDDRPLGEILQDPEAFDLAAVARRLKLSPAMLKEVYPSAGEDGAP